MSHKSKLAILGVFVFLTFSVYAKIFHLQTPKDFFLNNSASVQVAELLASSSKIYAIDPRTKLSNCKINGPYPDHLCSPGAIFSNAGTSTICVSGYTKTVRNVSTSLKKQVYLEYGIAYPQPTGSYEADHLIPLELGGSNDIANLFPEAANPNPGFKEKDLVENYLHKQVCAGALNLLDAQKQIANDWLAVYNALSPTEVASLKSEYASWADKN
jgi:hypothetical protein